MTDSTPFVVTWNRRESRMNFLNFMSKYIAEIAESKADELHVKSEVDLPGYGEEVGEP